MQSAPINAAFAIALDSRWSAASEWPRDRRSCVRVINALSSLLAAAAAADELTCLLGLERRAEYAGGSDELARGRRRQRRANCAARN